MGLKCSILGHRFEETEVERDREEQGSEVVTTIRELETCTRCGERQVVSENKEVTTLATPDEPAEGTADDAPADADGEATADSAAEEESAAESTADDTVDSAEIVEETTTTSIPDAEAVTEDTDDSDGPADERGPTASPESDTTDDAVILDDGDDTAPERDPGEWPDEPEDRLQSPEDAADWPDSGREGAAEDDGYETPLLQEDDDTRPASEADVTVPEGTYRCDECGFTTDVEASSLRRGDFCPECHRGTLVQEVDEA